jgi:hypothetical protein
MLFLRLEVLLAAIAVGINGVAGGFNNPRNLQDLKTREVSFSPLVQIQSYCGGSHAFVFL